MRRPARPTRARRRVTAPSITTTVADTIVVGFFATADDATFTPPSGMTERFDVLADGTARRRRRGRRRRPGEPPARPGPRSPPPRLPRSTSAPSSGSGRPGRRSTSGSKASSASRAGTSARATASRSTPPPATRSSATRSSACRSGQLGVSLALVVQRDGHGQRRDGSGLAPRRPTPAPHQRRQHGHVQRRRRRPLHVHQPGDRRHGHDVHPPGRRCSRRWSRTRASAPTSSS